jgi:hypothetical protein
MLLAAECKIEQGQPLATSATTESRELGYVRKLYSLIYVLLSLHYCRQRASYRKVLVIEGLGS